MINDPDEKSLKEQRELALTQSPSVDVAAYVVLYRGLGIDREFALCCMAELARRRTLGDEFDFETFIEQELEKLPKFTGIDLPKVTQSVMNNAGSLKQYIKK